MIQNKEMILLIYRRLKLQYIKCIRKIKTKANTVEKNHFKEKMWKISLK